jgi:hypothetical protein
LILQLLVLLQVHAHWIILLGREHRAVIFINSRHLTSSVLLLLLMMLTQLRNLCFQVCYSLPWLWRIWFYRMLVYLEASLVVHISTLSRDLIE